MCFEIIKNKNTNIYEICQKMNNIFKNQLLFLSPMRLFFYIHYVYFFCISYLVNYIIYNYLVSVFDPSTLCNANNNNIYEQYTVNSVVNISDVKLSKAELDLLSKGLNFCPTPGEPDFGEIRRDLDTFHTRLRQKNYFAEQTGPDREQEGECITDSPDPGPTPFNHRKFNLPSGLHQAQEHWKHS